LMLFKGADKAPYFMVSHIALHAYRKLYNLIDFNSRLSKKLSFYW
jgi:hypothetical protein